MSIEDLSPLTEIAAQYPHALDIINYMWVNASTVVTKVEKVRENIDKVMPRLIKVFHGTDAVTFIRFAGDSIQKIAPEVSHSSHFAFLDALLTVLQIGYSPNPNMV